MLLQAPYGARTDARMREHFDRLIDRVNAYEVTALAQGDGFSETKSEAAPIDEILKNATTFPAPVADAETVETELMLADLDSLEKRVPNLIKKAQQGDKEAKVQASVLGQALELLRESRPARDVAPKDEEERKALDQAQLLTAKPVLYVCNVDEGNAASGNAHSTRVIEMAQAQGAKAVIISAAIEAEIATMDPADRIEFLGDLGLAETGLSRIIRAGYALLDLITFFTAGPKEARAWTVEKGAKAPAAAGVIHSDFERGFIRAETIAFDDYVGFGGESGARDAGKLRSEGKDYVVRDGDVMLFRFNV